MTYLHQPNFEMAAPEYWGGIDINDDAAFSGTDFVTALLPAKAVIAASVRLTDCLQKVVADDYVETSSNMGQRFDATEKQLPDGSVVVVDSEQLRREVCPDVLGLDHRKMRPYSGIPISEPFAEYWKKSHHALSKEDNGFGRDEMHLPDQVTYRRKLQWGVLLTGSTGNRILMSQEFDGPRIDDQGISMDTWPSEVARPVPFEIGTVQTYGDFTAANRSYRLVERIRAVNVIHHAFDTNVFVDDYMPNPGLLQRLGGLWLRRL